MAKFEDLKDKKVLVTGATRGIGRAIALNLASQGAHVVFNFREGKEEIAKQMEEELKAAGAANATAVMFDVTNSEQIKTALDAFNKEHGAITGLVNNAGISKDQIVLRLKEEDITQTLDTNLKGSILVTSALSRAFLRAENVSIVNISSVVGLMGNPSQIAYAASKAGMLGFTKSYAKELASRNVRCNAICPGFIETDMTEALDEKVKEAYLSSIPLNRLGNVEEVANLVNFLLSRASSYITGEVIKIDGGLYI
ncbi:beta-ketoacyl-ACP reductase [Halobacteriovorax marinus]|uniref:3-oxoacyl-[acyl-carrier protein] reductase n=1 Tax=Halobacteriovorax marinus (strain ATCC BAA-682 / DSM 15412 / SJ) TaxID=862908 RepID=E1WY13_HALMS|nr:beta-ketoacyl-ACP reductase [Halobacteriovorax marinus]CBW27568.1 3-oxoacyl-[acyl-carrier protein] reductase [Halobacteriovorax marinus SJ]